jgi:hypothetical protein
MTKFNKPMGLLAALIVAATPALAANMPKGEYTAAKDGIKATYKVDLKACDGMTGNAKDICKEEAKGKEKVALADLEYRYTGKDGDATKLAKAKAEAVYDVAKEKCDDLAGPEKSACVATAKQEYERAKPH